MIKTKNLYKDYGDGAVLKDINLTFNDHEITVIMGPSGSGKSTLLRCLNYLEVPSQGEVRVGDILLKEEPNILSEVRKNVSMVFQSFHLFNHYTALKNCMIAPMKVLKLSEETARVNAQNALTEVGLSAFINRKPSQLSGGQKQRVAIARSLAMHPDVILFDEPTSALDPENVQEVLQTMASLARKKMTMIIVTHEMQFAKKIADRVIFMENGEVIEDQPARTFFDDPRSEKAKNFIAHLQ